MQRCFILFSVLGWKTELCPKYVAGCICQCSYWGRVVDSDVNGFFDGSGHTMSLPSYNFEVFHWCCVTSSIVMFNIGDGAFRCSLYLSSKVLAGSPIYSSSYSVLSHLYQYMMLLCFVMASLSLGNINRFFKVFPPLKYTWTPYLLQMVL